MRAPRRGPVRPLSAEDQARLVRQGSRLPRMRQRLIDVQKALDDPRTTPERRLAYQDEARRLRDSIKRAERKAAKKVLDVT